MGYGIQRCIVGYSGGKQPNPTYSQMYDHTESLFIEYDPSVVSYESILNKWKSITVPYEAKLQYRSAIFFVDKDQERIAREMCGGMEFVDIEPATKFYMAEERHQNFLDRM